MLRRESKAEIKTGNIEVLSHQPGSEVIDNRRDRALPERSSESVGKRSLEALNDAAVALADDPRCPDLPVRVLGAAPVDTQRDPSTELKCHCRHGYGEL